MGSLIPEYKIPKENWYAPKVRSLCHQSRIINKIFKKLDGVQLEIFRASCFGHLLSIKDMPVSSHLTHALLLRQIRSDMEDGLQFLIGNSITSFCEHDFSLVTGLKCGELPQLVEVAPSDIPLKAKYFTKLDSIPLSSLEDAFSECLDVEDSLKLALVLFAEGILNGRETCKPIELHHLMLVEDLHEFNKYPWGSFSWKYTIECLRDVLDGGRGYCIRGFPPALQVWAFEVIPDLENYNFCSKIKKSPSYPRISTWTCGKLRMEKLSTQIFEEDTPTRVVSLIPTAIEKQQSWWTFGELHESVIGGRKRNKAKCGKSTIVEEGELRSKVEYLLKELCDMKRDNRIIKSRLHTKKIGLRNHRNLIRGQYPIFRQSPFRKGNSKGDKLVRKSSAGNEDDTHRSESLCIEDKVYDNVVEDNSQHQPASPPLDVLRPKATEEDGLRVREDKYESVERLIREKERELEELDKHVKERSVKLNLVEEIVEVKMKEVEIMERSVRQEEKTLYDVRGMIEERRKELQLKEGEMIKVKRGIEDCERELKGKEERMKQVEGLIVDCSKVLESKEEMVRVADLKGREFSLLKRSMEEWGCKVEVKERELEGLAAKLELKEKEVESKVEELGLIRKEFLDAVQFREQRLDSLERSLVEWEKDLHELQKSVQECSRGSEFSRDGRGLQLFMDEHLKRIDSMGTELSAILKESSDPGKLVLDAMQGFYPENRESGFELRVRRRSCILLLEELMRISPQMNPQLKEEAAKLSADWKAKMTAASDKDLEVLGFLRLIAAYGLNSTYDAKELRRLLSMVSHGLQAAEIGLALGITAPGSSTFFPVKIEDPESYAANNAAAFSSPDPQSSAATDARNSASYNSATISSPNPESSALKDARGLQGSVDGSLSWNLDTIQDELLASVQSVKDPEKFVLEMMQKSLVKCWASAEASLKKSVMSCNIFLLKVLMTVSPEVGSHVKEDAKRLGLEWKAKIRGDADHLEHLMEIVGFLLFTVAYGLLPTLHVDEIVKFLGRLSQHIEALESCQMRGFLDKNLGVFIQTLVERKQLFEAIGFVFKFKLLDKFTPVRVLKDYANNVRTCFSETLKRKKSVDEQVEFVDHQIADLKAVLRCIKEYNLESEYPSTEIAVEVQLLEQLKEIGLKKCLGVVTGQPEQSRGKKRNSSTCSPSVQQGQQKKNFHLTAEASPSSYKSSNEHLTPRASWSRTSRPWLNFANGNYEQHEEVGDMAATSAEADRSSSMRSGNEQRS